MQARNNPARALLLRSVGFALSVIPVSLSILSYFPLWIEREDASILSGLSLVLLALGAVPIFRLVKNTLRSPSAPLMWFICFVLFFLLSKIGTEMTVISLVGFVSNLAGSVFFKLAKRNRSEVGDEKRT